MPATFRAALAALAPFSLAAGLAAAAPVVTASASSSPSAIAPATVYVVNEGGGVVPGTVSPISTATNVAQAPINVGGFPITIAITPNGSTAYVTDVSSRNVVTPISTATNKPGRPIRVGVGPFNLAITPSGKEVYVANDDSNSVTPISVSSGRPGRSIPVAVGPSFIKVAANGKTVYTVGLTQLSAITTATNKARKPVTIGGGGHAMALSPDSTTVYVSNGNTLLRISARTLRVTGRIKVGANWGVAISPNGKTLYTFACSARETYGTMTPIPTATLRPRKAVRLGFCVASEVFSPDGKTLYIVDSPDGLVSGSVVPVSTVTNEAGSPISVGEQPGPLAMFQGAAGDTLYVVNTGSGSVTPISTATDQAGPSIPVGYLPTSIAIAR